MMIIGVDFHREFQQIASVDTDWGISREASAASRGRGGVFTVHWQREE